MLILGVLSGLILGLAAGGRLSGLAAIQLRWPTLVLAALGLRILIELGLGRDNLIVETLRLPLFTLAFGLLLVALWVNRSQPGLSLAFVGVALNTIPILVNGGAMPVWEPSLIAAGFDPAVLSSNVHVLLPATPDLAFLLQAGPLGDVIPIPLPVVRNVASIGDLFLAGGLAFFIFAALVRARDELDEQTRATIAARLDRLAAARTWPERLPGLRHGRAAMSLAPGLAEASVLERPMSLGGPGSGPGPTAARLPFGRSIDTASIGSAAAATIPVAEPAGRLPWSRVAATRVRQHPYVRLAVNPSFSALWAGQLISLFGDRIHQVALAFLIYGETGSSIALGGVFVAAALPNLFLPPIAGAFVDRWDHRQVMVVSDLIRAGLVALIPVAVVANLLLVYPMVFALTAVSIFFRPARIAIMPRIVKEDELLTANSASWIAETLADIVGYVVAGLFAAFLGTALVLAFWLDAASYVASALLIATIVVPPLAAKKATQPAIDDGAAVDPNDAIDANGAIDADGQPAPSLVGELRSGWRFLRGDLVLLANTLQATVAQFGIGILVVLTPFYAADFLDRGALDERTAYGLLEAAIGVGNLVGGFALGLIGARLARGRAIIGGYVVFGVCTMLMAVTGNVAVVIGLLVGSGIANMAFVIPSQTIFQERTPGDLIGRVIGFRFALVFGAMTVAMGVGGVLGAWFGPAAVIGAFGVVTVAAGLAGFFIPAVRDA